MFKHFENKYIRINLFKINNFNYGGENGIRTHEKITPLHAFQACALNHSAISPYCILKKFKFI